MQQLCASGVAGVEGPPNTRKPTASTHCHTQPHTSPTSRVKSVETVSTQPLPHSHTQLLVKQEHSLQSFEQPVKDLLCALWIGSLSPGVPEGQEVLLAQARACVESAGAVQPRPPPVAEGVGPTRV